RKISIAPATPFPSPSPSPTPQPSPPPPPPSSIQFRIRLAEESTESLRSREIHYYQHFNVVVVVVVEGVNAALLVDFAVILLGDCCSCSGGGGCLLQQVKVLRLEFANVVELIVFVDGGNSFTSSAHFATSNQAVSRGGYQSSKFPKWGSQNIFGFPSYPVSSFVPPRNGKVSFK
ncbi:hypothetical protein C5167_051018, partial [Papaver somniferum]